MMKYKTKIICVHLFNDFSGSPKVLAQVASILKGAGYDVSIFSSFKGRVGFLTGIKGVKEVHIPYFWSPTKLITLFSYLINQLLLLITILTTRGNRHIVYVNTLLPFGAAIAAKIRGFKVVYHIHETSIRPLLLKHFLLKIAEETADEAIYVSEFLMQEEPLEKVSKQVIYNALSDDFIRKGKKHQEEVSIQPDSGFNVLMLSSLKVYKGVDEFVSLANNLPNNTFELVINANQIEIDAFFGKANFPDNLTIYPSQSNVHPFYAKANLVLNLSHPDKWVETFGLTALEAFTYGIPVIVPPVGGIAEVVIDGDCGYHMDVRNTQLLQQRIEQLADDKVLYGNLSKGAIQRADIFTLKAMENSILMMISEMVVC